MHFGWTVIKVHKLHVKREEERQTQIRDILHSSSSGNSFSCNRVFLADRARPDKRYVSVSWHSKSTFQLKGKSICPNQGQPKWAAVLRRVKQAFKRYLQFSDCTTKELGREIYGAIKVTKRLTSSLPRVVVHPNKHTLWKINSRT